MFRRMSWVWIVSLLIAGCSDDSAKTDTGAGSSDKSVTAEASTGTCGTSAFAPADGTVADYTKGTPKVATTAKELQDLIDGGSEKYSNNQFACMVQVVYTNSTKGVTLEAWIFDQTNAAGAEAAMTAALSADDTELTPKIGDASKENTKLLSNYTVIMRKGQYVGRILASKKDASADAVALLTAIAGAMP